MEPLAIIGLACRFPGEATNVENLWNCLLEGRSLAMQIPKEKFNVNGHYHPDPNRGGSFYTKIGHFLAESTALFDAPFFSMSKSEAMAVDPQQRLMLENVYHAFENAGLPMNSVISSKTSVFVGGGITQDYMYMLNHDTELVLKFKGTGTSGAMVSNRISWFYDLKGTSLSIDTACSSSLVALHHACQNLRHGDSEMAVVSGVNVMEDPCSSVMLGALGMLSPEGKCYSFDHRANGYGRGEGVGTVIIKPLSAAIRDRNTIRAVIRATGSNQDGRTPGVTLPSQDAQERLIRKVYSDAGLDRSATRYVEAHGTGTFAGDPVEARAIAGAFESSKNQQPLYIGSIKANVGHLEAAAGIAGLIKAVMVVENGIIPPAANFEAVNPKIPLDEWNIRIATAPITLPHGDVRRVSVNSFGFGGTNAHAVVDDVWSVLLERSMQSVYADSKLHHQTLLGAFHGKWNLNGSDGLLSGLSTPDSTTPLSSAATNLHNGVDTHAGANGVNGVNKFVSRTEAINNSSANTKVFILSAFDETGIQRSAISLSEHLKSLSAVDSKPSSGHSYMGDLAYTLSAKRNMFPWKSFCLASSEVALIENLQKNVSKPVRTGNAEPRIGFIFTGQGAQWPAMGKALASYPIFNRSINDAAEYMVSLGSPWNLNDVLHDWMSDIQDPFLSQAACTAVQVALVDLLASWNIKPTRVIGHSSGEIAAAYCAGKISRKDAWKLAYFRGYVSSKQINRAGAMLAVGTSSEAIQPYLDAIHSQEGRRGKLAVACFNSPNNFTVSGDEEEIDILHSSLAKDAVFSKKLAVRNAYHSYHMQDVAETYLDLIGDLSAPPPQDREPRVEMISTVSASSLCESEAQSANYWVKNLVSPVRFSDALVAMSTAGETTGQTRLRLGTKGPVRIHHVVEIGSHSALRSAVRETLASVKGLSMIEYHHVLTRNELTPAYLLSTAAGLYCHGYPVAMNVVNNCEESQNARTPQLLTSLPPYEFNHSRKYWAESRLSKNYRHRELPRHDLCGAKVADWNPEEPRWRGFLRISELPWLKDHEITGNVIFPGVGYSIMVIEASKQIADPEQILTAVRLKDVAYKAALMIPDTPNGIEYVLSMRKTIETSAEISLHWREFRIFSCGTEDQEWTEHCSGFVQLEYDLANGEVDDGREATAEILADRETMALAESVCHDTLSTAAAYDGWDKIGISWGPLFRNISEIRLGDKSGKSLSTVTIPDVASSMPSGYLQEHTIQPATMDSLLATSMTAVMDGGSRGAKIRSSHLPTFIKETWISMSIPNEPGHKFQCYAQAKLLGFNQNQADIMVWDPSTSRTVMRLSGVKTKPLQTSTSGPENATTHPCYFIEWQPHLDLLTKGSLVFQKMLTRLSDSVVQKEYIQRSQLVSMIYISNALRDLKTLETITMQPHHRRYLEWMRYQEKRMLDGNVPQLNYQAVKELFGDLHARSRFVADVPVLTARERLLHRVGPQIGRILAHEVDPLEIMFRQDNLMDHFYAESSVLGNTKALLDKLLGAIGHSSTNLKVIEIGAGTGSTTLPVLNALSPRSSSDDNENAVSRILSYTYTDISAGFFEHAKAKFELWENIMEYSTLDIESSPVAQGFEEGVYDVVIASNVLHATSQLSKTLANARSLLREGGRLILVEAVREDVLLGPACFGLLPGWWRSSEAIRPWGPLTNETNWDIMLTDSGFSGTDITLNDFNDPELHELCIFVSTAVSPTPASRVEFSQQVYIIRSESKGLEEALALALETQMLSGGFPNCSVIDYYHTSHMNLEGALCVLLMGQQDLTAINEHEFQSIKHILNSASSILWVSDDELENPLLAAATGLIRTARWERDLDQTNFAMLSIEGPMPPAAALAAKILKICHRLPAESPAYERNSEYWLRDGEFWTSRLRESAKTTRHLDIISNDLKPSLQPYGARRDRALKLTTSQPGMLSKLLFTSDPMWPTPLAPQDVEVKIEAVSLNFRDVMVAMGQLPHTTLGYEGVGTVTRIGSDVVRVAVGDRVVTYGANKASGTLQTYYRVTQTAAIKLPAKIGVQEAVTLPFVFMTALYGLRVIARLAANESILIHSAAGGIGQAAIQIAQLAGAEIFATVSTNSKRDFLIREYGISPERIFSSRDLSFVKGIKRMTNSRGVDVVLNSLSGEALRRSWDCIAPSGRFIELGNRDIVANGRLHMAPFSNNVLYFGMDMKLIMEEAPATATALVEETFELYLKGKVRAPFPVSVYSYAELESALRQLQSGKTMGKVVLVPKEDDLVQVLPEMPTPLKFPEAATYVLAGGLGGIGRSIARWMASRGARNFVFLSRSGARSSEAQGLIAHLEKNGCRAASYICDIADKSQLAAIIAECQTTLPPIKGCIHGCMALEDAMLANMTHANWVAATRPKIRGSINLHEVLDTGLDFFLMLSSVASIVGNRGQANYAAGNAFQDAFARHLVTKGIRSNTASLNLSSIASVGYVAEKLDRARAMVLPWSIISEARMHEIIEYHLDPRVNLNLCFAADGYRRHQSIAGIMTMETITAKGLVPPECLHYPLFTHFHTQEPSAKAQAQAPAGEKENELATQQLLCAADSFDIAVAAVQEAVQKKIASLMAIPWGEIEASKPLQAYGVDSLVAVELRTWASKAMRADVAVLDMLGRNTIEQFSHKVARASSLVTVAAVKLAGDDS